MELVTFVEFRISMLFLALFLLLFVRLKYSIRQSVLILTIFYLLTGVIDGVECLYLGRTQHTLLGIILQIFLVEVTALLLNEYRDFRGLFTGITSALYVIPGNLAGVIGYLFSDSNLWGIVLQFLLHGVLLAILCWLVRKEYLHEMASIQYGWGFLCLIPICFYLLLNTLIVWPSNIHEVPQNIFAVSAALMLLILVYILITTFFARRREQYELTWKNDFLEQHVHNLEKEMEAIEMINKEMAVMRHDLYHYLDLVFVYLDNGETDKIRELLQGISQQLEELQNKKYCDNTALNGIINHWKDRMDSQEIQLDYQIDFPRQFQDNSFEFYFAVLMSNLLRNAVQAVEKVENKEERQIHLNIFQREGQILLKISNPYEGKPNLDEEGHLLTTQGEGHGYGIQSIERFVQRYQALFDYSYEDHWFFVRMMIPTKGLV